MILVFWLFYRENALGIGKNFFLFFLFFFLVPVRLFVQAMGGRKKKFLGHPRHYYEAVKLKCPSKNFSKLQQEEQKSFQKN